MLAVTGNQAIQFTLFGHRGKDHALAAADVSDAGYGAPGGAAALLFIHFESGEGADLNESRPFVDEILDAFSRGKLVFFVLFFGRRFSAAQHDLFQPVPPAAHCDAKCIFILVKIQGLRVHRKAI